MSVKPTVSMDIISSCVCRDCFEIGKRALMHNQYSIKLFFQGMSPFSLYTNPESALQTISEENLVWGNPWVKRMIVTDLRKDLFQRIGEDRKDSFLLLDFTDFSRDILILKTDGAYLTKTEYLMKNEELIKDCVKETVSVQSLPKEYLNNCLDRYIEDILKRYESSRIILCKVYYVDKYISYLGEEKYFSPVTELNEFADYCYTYFINAMESKNHKIHVIEFPSNTVCYELHKWGCNNRHFCDEYYEYLLSAIDCCTSMYDEDVEKSMLDALLEKCNREFDRISSLAALNSEVKCIKSSRSYKIGKLLTFIPRKLKKGLKTVFAHLPHPKRHQ